MTEIQCFARSALRWNNRRVEVRFADIEGELVCIGVEIGPKLSDEEVFVAVNQDDLRPIAAAEMRVPLRRLVDRALQSAVMVRAGSGDFAPDHEALAQDLGRLRSAQAQPRKRTGRPPAYQPDHFAEVARVYTEHKRGGGRAPTKAVQEHFVVTKSTAAKWVARAREMQLLEPSEGSHNA